MRGTTTFRSSRAPLFVLAAVALAAPRATAQDTAQVAPDPAQAAAALGQLPETHLVVQGESLWSIAFLYFTDPMLWPEIYRMNTAVIEDPHWIYPGEVLVLGPQAAMIAQAPGATPGDTVRAQPQAADTIVAGPVDTEVADTAQVVIVEPPPSDPVTGYETIFDRPRSRRDEIQRTLRAYAEQPYRPVRRGEFYAAGFLTEDERLPWGTVLGNTDRPSIRRLTPSSSATTFDEIAIQPPRNASYHVGDSLLIARIDRLVEGWGEVIVPHGIARVTEVHERQVLAEVVLQFARVRNRNLAMPLEPFRDPGEGRPTAVAQGLEGRVIAPRDLHALLNQQQYLFLDKGRGDGVAPGDFFEVYRPTTGEPGAASERVFATLLIVHTRERSATGLIIGMSNPAITPGTPARLVKKMPS
jgi:hypothetical protein